MTTKHIVIVSLVGVTLSLAIIVLLFSISLMVRNIMHGQRDHNHNLELINQSLMGGEYIGVDKDNQ